MQDIKLRNHVIICGWNPNGINVLGSFSASLGARKNPVVLINMLEAEVFDSLKAQFPSLDLRFVRGDHTQETTLKRASAQQARSCIVLPDSSGQSTLTNADERTILACFAIKSLNPDAVVSAEILKADSEQHLHRVGIEDIVVNGEFSGFLLSAAAASSGIPQAVRELLSWSSASRLQQSPIPQALIGKNFHEASEWFLQNGKGILIGVLSQEKQVSLDDLLSDDASAIDSFIKRKFQEADIDLAGEMRTGTEIKLNPGPTYVIRDLDLGFTIG